MSRSAAGDSTCPRRAVLRGRRLVVSLSAWCCSQTGVEGKPPAGMKFSLSDAQPAGLRENQPTCSVPHLSKDRCPALQLTPQSSLGLWIRFQNDLILPTLKARSIRTRWGQAHRLASTAIPPTPWPGGSVGWGHTPAGAALGGTLGCRCHLAGGGASLSSTTARVRLLHSPLHCPSKTVPKQRRQPCPSRLCARLCSLTEHLLPMPQGRTAQGDPSAADTESRCRRVG